MLLLHILIALSSLGVTTFLVFSPSKVTLRISYGLAASTLTTGTYLVVSSGSHMLEACAMGLFYLGVTSLGILKARQKLALQRLRSK